MANTSNSVVNLVATCASKNARDLVVTGVRVEEGDRVAADQLVAIVEFNKVVTEVTSPVDGIVEKVHVSLRDEVQVGDRLIDIRPLPS